MSTTRAPQLPNARVALYNFVQDRLTAVTGRTLAEFILERRPEADPVPYRRIASELVDLTGIDITHEAVRRWHHRALEAEPLEVLPVSPARAAELTAHFTS